MKKSIEIWLWYLVMGWGMLALFNYGIIVDDSGFTDVAAFWFWVSSILGLFTLSDKYEDSIIKKVKEENLKLLPMLVVVVFNIVAIINLVYYGFIYLAIFYTISFIFSSSARASIDKKLKEVQNAKC